MSFDDMSSSTTQLSQITLTASEVKSLVPERLGMRLNYLLITQVQFSDDQSQIQTTIPLTDIQAIQVNTK